MKAVYRILVMVNLAFLLALSLSLMVLLEQGRDDVIREQKAMVPVVEALLVAGLPRESWQQLGDSLRHVRLYRPGETPEPHAGVAPDWFVGLFRHPSGVSQLALTASGGERLLLVADDSDEIGEVWDSSLQMAGVFLLAMLVSNLAIFWGVNRGIRPLALVNQALRAIETGEYGTRLKPSGVLEVDQLAGYVNDMATALQQAEADNRQLTRSLMRVQEQERAALARELHDDLGQYMTAIRTQAWLIPYQQHNPEQLRLLSEQVVNGCDAVQTGFRRIIHNLYPVVLEQLGLASAIEELAGQLSDTHGLDIELELDLPVGMQESAVAHIYRLIQEALNNVIRHAHATRILVSIETDGGFLRLSIADNGRGVSGQLLPGVGLRSMKERCQLLGGQWQIHPSPLASTGIEVSACLPLANIAGMENDENSAGR